MNKIKSKIYYLISTGEILVITSEKLGSIELTTKDEDMNSFPELKDKNIDEVDYVELEHGTLANTFNNIKSYLINLETKSLECIYFTQEELDSIQQQKQEAQELDNRVTDISTYLSNSGVNTISDIENSILEIEKNKILEGMM